MSWFGFGGGGDKPPSSSGSGSSSFNTSSFPGDDTARNFSSPSMGSSAVGGGDAFQNEVMQFQQAQMAQLVVTKLTDVAFKKCVTRPSTSLSSSEKSCIQAQVGKFIESSQFVVQGLSQG